MNETAEQLARAFARRIRTSTTRAELEIIVLRNQEEPMTGVCHTQDFLDANVLMEDAFAEIIGRGPEPDSEADADLWNLAWNLARESKFGR